MVDVEKLNVDSIIVRLLEGQFCYGYFYFKIGSKFFMVIMFFFFFSVRFKIGEECLIYRSGNKRILYKIMRNFFELIDFFRIGSFF